MAVLSVMNCVKPQKEDKLTTEVWQTYSAQVPEWQIVTREGVPQLERVFPFKNFATALEFTNKVGKLAEEQDHHPRIITEWGKVTVTYWTHFIHGLHINDFIMAAKTDLLE